MNILNAFEQRTLENQLERCFSSFEECLERHYRTEASELIECAKQLVDSGEIDDDALVEIYTKFLFNPAENIINTAMLAAIYFYISQTAIQNGDREGGWYFLSEAHHYSAVFSYIIFLKKPVNTASKKGNDSKKRKLDSAKLFAADLLRKHREKRNEGWLNHQDAAMSIQGELSDFVRSKSIPLKTDVIVKRILDWIKSDDIVRAAYEQTAAQPKSPGQKKS